MQESAGQGNLAPEIIHVGLVHRFLARHDDVVGIDEPPVLPHAEIKMRTSGKTGGSHKTDNISPFHLRALLQIPGETGKMGILRFQPIAVPDDNHLAISLSPPGPGNDPVAHASDRRPVRSRVINALVRAYHPENGVTAFQVEFRTDAGKGQRSLEPSEGLLLWRCNDGELRPLRHRDRLRNACPGW